MQTKGELITACIKLMYDNTDSYIDPENVSFTLQEGEGTPTANDIESAEYAHRTVNIIEAINRAFHRIAQYGKLPKASLHIDKDTAYIANTINTRTYNLRVLTDGAYRRIFKILYADKCGNISSVKSTFITNEKVILPVISSGMFEVVYDINAKEIKYDDLDTLDLTIYGYTEEMLNYVPYSVKADLYEEDNPEMAYASRNLFETYIQGLPDNESDIYDVEDVMNVW